MVSIIKEFHRRLVQPRSHQTEIARKEYIFNILLIGSLYLVGLALILVSFNAMKSLPLNQEFHGAPPELLVSIFLGLVSFYKISHAGRPQLAAALYLFLLWLGAAYASLRWGAMLYQPILIYALVIIFSGILLNTQITFIMTAVTVGWLITLTQLQASGFLYVDTLWRDSPPDLSNAVIVSFTFGIIALFSWLANQEISQALSKAQRAKLALTTERNQLELKVRKRTQQLKETQLAKMIQWQRLVDVGKLASGLFHDLRNYLTSASLDLELNEVQSAFSTLQNMGQFVHSTQKQLTSQQKKEWFTPAKEIKEIMAILRHKANENQVKLNAVDLSSQRLYGCVSIFHQIMMNLISNAIDSYATQKKSPTPPVIVTLKKLNSQLILTIQDFGIGMTLKQQAQLFQPFFTTKANTDGFGLGLFLTRSALEKYFAGHIKVTSKYHQGTKFILTFPLILTQEQA